MPILADCHMHSHHSGDSDAAMESMIERSIELGLKYICLTEHQDLDFIYEPEEPKDLFEVNTKAYRDELMRLKDKYKDCIKICFGIELGLQTHIADRLYDYAGSYDFDFIIASSHICNRKDPYLKSYFEDQDEQEAYREYFSYIHECLLSYDDFDVYGHMDYVLRYGPTKNKNFQYKDYQDIIDPILSSLIKMGKGIELNTSGYSYHLEEPHPCRAILSRYKELGGEILTIGSDAHNPESIAADFNRAEKLLTDCGFKYYTLFENRRPKFYPI